MGTLTALFVLVAAACFGAHIAHSGTSYLGAALTRSALAAAGLLGLGVTTVHYGPLGGIIALGVTAAAGLALDSLTALAARITRTRRRVSAWWLLTPAALFAAHFLLPAYGEVYVLAIVTAVTGAVVQWMHGFASARAHRRQHAVAHPSVV